MARRRQKLSKARARTAWLAWCAWGVIGSIFLFEDVAGGTGWLTMILTAPFWLMFALWPVLWAWLRLREAPESVEMDEDFPVAGKSIRVVQKDGERFAEKASFAAVFPGEAGKLKETRKIPGGDEEFFPFSAISRLAGENPELSAWLDAMERIPFVR